MANYLTTLIRMSKNTIEESGITNHSDGEPLEGIHHFLYDHISDLLKPHIGKIIDFIVDYPGHTPGYHSDFVLGTLRPNDIRTVANSWNKEITTEAIRSFSAFEDQKNKCGGWEELFEKIEDIREGKVGGLYSFRYEFELHRFAKILCALDNALTYGGDRVFLKETTYGSEFSVMLPVGAKEYITKHPEEFAIVNILYK